MLSFKTLFAKKEAKIPNDRLQVAAAGNRADRKEAADWVGRKKPVDRQVKENEVAANAAGAGGVAGIGIGPHGEPGVRKKKAQPLLRPDMFRRGGQRADK